MSTIVWTKAAVADIERHHEFLELTNPDTARKAVQEILKKGESLKQNPRRGSIVTQAEGLRKLMIPFGKYGFVMHYTIFDEDILILRIYHGREHRKS
jgi:plasmid stabilization system protein ParE